MDMAEASGGAETWQRPAAVQRHGRGQRRCRDMAEASGGAEETPECNSIFESVISITLRPAAVQRRHEGCDT